MNRISKYSFIRLCTVVVLFIFASCGEDRSGEYAELTQEDRWIEQQMQNIYLWYYDMPTVKEENYFAEPKEFFESLLSTKCRDGEGDHFSYFESDKTDNSATDNSLLIDETSSYGFDFMIYNDPTGTTAHKMARVLFVLPDSPADEAGLKRGDWILKVRGINVTDNNYGYLLQGGATTLTTASLNSTTEEGEIVLSWGEETTLEIGASRQVTSNPFYKVEVFSQSGKNIGYLMYDHYSPGPTDTSTEYNEKMKQIFGDFKSRGVNEFILDLRYNPGGVMSCITELCSFLAPVQNLGQPLFSLQYNNLNTNRNTTSHLNANLAAQNLGLNTLYVITSPYTASASETTIYCLKPYMDVKVIGSTTVGKNVASLGIASPYNFTLHPIVATIYNCKNQSDYENGIRPDYFYNEFSNTDPLGEIGDPQSDALLKYTIQWILNGSLNLPTTETGIASFRSNGRELSPHFTTLDHKRARGNILTE